MTNTSSNGFLYFINLIRLCFYTIACKGDTFSYSWCILIFQTGDLIWFKVRDYGAVYLIFLCGCKKQTTSMDVNLCKKWTCLMLFQEQKQFISSLSVLQQQAAPKISHILKF